MASIAPLSGIKVIDLTKLAPGPHCTMILGDLGADIIKVEEPGAPTGRRAEQAAASGKTQRPATGLGVHNALGRNKKSIGLNLKSGPGREVFLRMAQRADVVVEEFRPGVAKRLGIDYSMLGARNPRLVYCAVPRLRWPRPQLYRAVGRPLDDRAQGSAADDPAEPACRLCGGRDARGDRRARGAARAPSDRPRTIRRYRDAGRDDAADRAGALEPLRQGMDSATRCDHPRRLGALLQSLSDQGR